MEPTRPSDIAPLPWYQKTWVIILFLIFFFPIGLFLVWKHQKWSVRTKQAVTAGYVVWILFAVLINNLEPPKTTDTASSIGGQQHQQQTSAEPIKNEATPEQKLEELMREVFRDRLREVDVHAFPVGGYSVHVEFTNDTNFSPGMDKYSIERDMKQAYKALYTSGLNVQQATMSAYKKLQDRFGNESEDMVYKTIMNRDIGEKIQWDKQDTLNFDNLWSVAYIHPGFEG